MIRSSLEEELLDILGIVESYHESALHIHPTVFSLSIIMVVSSLNAESHLEEKQLFLKCRVARA
jgi:prenyltransferase beta subunit